MPYQPSFFSSLFRHRTALVTLFNQFLPLAINVLALGVSLIFMVQGAKALESVEENKRTYMMAIVKTVVLIVTLIIVYFVIKGNIFDMIFGMVDMMEDLF